MIVETIADKMTDSEVTITKLSDALGKIAEERNAGYELAPADKRVAWMFIGVRQTGGTKAPAYVRVQFRPEVAVHLRDLGEHLGQWRPAAGNPEGSPFSVQFVFDRKEKPYVASIFVTLTGEPTSPSAVVEEVTIRRDARRQ